MLPGNYDLPPIHKGATYRLTLEWRDDSGAPVDLTGCTARLQARQTYDATAVLLDLSTTSGGITLGGVTGKIDLLVTDEVTSALSGGGGKYDLEIYHPSGDTTCLIRGHWAFTPGVTR